MRKFILAAAIAATSLSAIPAVAQDHPNREYHQDIRDARQDYRRDVRDANDRGDVRDARREYRHDVRDARNDRNRDWRQYRNYDYNRYENGQRTYYADRYYRAGSNYQVRRLGRNDRIYRGSDTSLLLPPQRRHDRPDHRRSGGAVCSAIRWPVADRARSARC